MIEPRDGIGMKIEKKQKTKTRTRFGRRCDGNYPLDDDDDDDDDDDGDDGEQNRTSSEGSMA